MSLNPVRIGSLRTVTYLCILAALASGCVLAQSQVQPNHGAASKTWPYSGPIFGNVGAWWMNVLNVNEKAAFLDGYQMAMAQGLSRIEATCKVLQDGVKPSSDQQAFLNQMNAVIGVCGQVSDFAGFEKITPKDLDDFYSDPINQFIVLDWSMGYLRDKATGRKTEGQLLDALKAEQKEVHDCSKYPHICKVGMEESGPAK